MTRGRLFLVLGCVFALTLCVAACDKKQVKKTETAVAYADPALEFRGIGFEEQSFSGMKAVFKFELLSTDKRPAKVTSCDYKLELRDLEAVRGKAEVGTDLAGQGKLPVLVRADIPWPEGIEAVQAFLGRKRVPYKFFLTCRVAGAGKTAEAANTDAGSIPLPKLPEIDVLQANAERFGKGEEAKINFELGMVNENPFVLPIDKINYKVYLGGKLVTEGEMIVAEMISPSNEVSYDVATPIFSVQHDKEILEMLKKPAIEYKLEGTVQMGKFTLPMNATGTISFPVR
ncbi:MAG: LEA type 2 family protein [Deltaproteobacteria bacterium]|nr:LEA type 2 family protein [Deltaproteobacteria bacterium]